jgi:tetratricopeptide (TPR) repeat protein
MALRLTTSQLATNDAPAPGAPYADLDGPAVTAIAVAGSIALQAGKLDDYQEQFARAAKLTDPNRRYQCQRALLEHAFTACGQASGRTAVEILVALATGAVTALEENPAEPVLLNYAGVAFHELWSLDAARDLFKAAQRLDREVPHVRRNLRQCAERRRLPGRPRRPLHPALPALARRAHSVASAAGPAQGLKLSLCMIVRDEEEMLPRCLEAVAPAVDEIIIVDTGSTDRTIEIARSFGARVIEREWTGSFSDARNVSFAAATGDWLLYLDADEVLVAEDVERLRALTGHTWREAFYFVETNFTGEEGTGTALTHSALRMFRNRAHYRFEGRLHEQIAQHLPAYIPERLKQTDVRIEHYGYLGVVRDMKGKSARNIELLRAQMAESAPTPFLHFNLGSEYFATGDAQAALTEYERSWAMILAQPEETHEFTPSLLSRMVKAMRVSGRVEESIARAAEGLARYPGFTDLVFDQAIAYVDLQRRDEAIAHFERCIEMGDAPARYTSLVGCGTYLPRISLAELQMQAGEMTEAVALLQWCVEHHPGFYGVVHPYATALLRSGHEGAEVVAEIESRVTQMSPTVRFMLGTALFERRAAAEAEAQFRAVIERQPASAAARVALGETLLYQRRYADGAAEVSKVAETDTLAPVAVRSELFGLLAAGELGAVPDVLERATRAGLDPAERSLFASWLGRAQGATDTPRAPLGAVPLLATMLEALLRVQDFETFETLHPLLAESELEERERRELLASIYLRRGYLKSAAREWMTVCEQAPDLRALIGLARVSHAHGLPQAAATFAQQALSLDPTSGAARAVLDAVAPTSTPAEAIAA